jgi:hypothetical protein
MQMLRVGALGHGGGQARSLNQSLTGERDVQKDNHFMGQRIEAFAARALYQNARDRLLLSRKPLQEGKQASLFHTPQPQMTCNQVSNSHSLAFQKLRLSIPPWQNLILTTHSSHESVQKGLTNENCILIYSKHEPRLNNRHNGRTKTQSRRFHALSSSVCVQPHGQSSAEGKCQQASCARFSSQCMLPYCSSRAFPAYRTYVQPFV